MAKANSDQQVRGRAALSNRDSRFSSIEHVTDEEWRGIDESQAGRQMRTEVQDASARTIISRNDSPDIPFTQSINPYKGCEHGCVYCYARPTHAYLGLSPGLDFETKIFAKGNAAELLVQELSKPGYVPSMIALGANTDPYQPTEKRMEITRAVLKVLADFNHPVGIITKSALVERDIDILAPMAEKGLARVFISIGTLDHSVSSKLEPRATAPNRRIEAIRKLAAAGIPAGVIVAPVIPSLTDKDIEAVLTAAASAGARYSGFVVLRLPMEVRDLFVEWLETNFPLKAKHVMSLVQQMRGGKDNDSNFGSRMRGTGEFADLIRRRFEVTSRRLGLNPREALEPHVEFSVPSNLKAQFSLF